MLRELKKLNKKLNYIILYSYINTIQLLYQSKGSCGESVMFPNLDSSFG
jgi:hypothetical protein